MRGLPRAGRRARAAFREVNLHGGLHGLPPHEKGQHRLHLLPRTTACITKIAAVSLLVAALAAARRPACSNPPSDIGITPKKGKVSSTQPPAYTASPGAGPTSGRARMPSTSSLRSSSGDVALTADVHFVGTGAVAHRKAALMIRQGLEPGSAYADAALHGDGLTSLQFRPAAAAVTQEIRSDLKGPSGFASSGEASASPCWPALRRRTEAHRPRHCRAARSCYVGFAVGSHNANILETAVFRNVKLESAAGPCGRATAARSQFTICATIRQGLYRPTKRSKRPTGRPTANTCSPTPGGRLAGSGRRQRRRA